MLKIFLECLPDDHSQWIPRCDDLRRQYDLLKQKYSGNPRSDQSELEVNNPLLQEEAVSINYVNTIMTA